MEDRLITKNRFIYKYLQINEFTLKTLINNELFFSIPKEFNDPLDCKFHLKLDPIPREEIVKQFYQNENLSEKEIEGKMMLFRSNNLQFQEDVENNYHEMLRKEYGISCFSERSDNFLMWSHYAHKHKGICLKFDWRLHPEYFRGFKVEYSKTLPEIIYQGNEILDASKIFLTKLNHWKYEKEIRSVVRLENGVQHASFDPKALTGIIFGERCSSHDRKTIKRIIENDKQYSHVRYFNALINYNNLKVKILQE